MTQGVSQVSGTQEWIAGARKAAKALRSMIKPVARPTPAPTDFPPVPYVQNGLRSLDDTMSMEAEEGKGRIINRYL